MHLVKLQNLDEKEAQKTWGEKGSVFKYLVYFIYFTIVYKKCQGRGQKDENKFFNDEENELFWAEARIGKARHCGKSGLTTCGQHTILNVAATCQHHQKTNTLPSCSRGLSARSHMAGQEEDIERL
jgi:hypothetical protein